MSGQRRIPSFFGEGTSPALSSPPATRKRERSSEKEINAKKQREMGDNKILLEELSKLIDRKISLLPSKEEMGQLIDQKMVNLASKQDIETLRTDIRSINTRVEELKKDNKKINTQLAELTQNHKILSDRFDELDRRGRKNNLIIRGIEYSGSVPTGDDLVLFFRSMLGVQMPLEAFSVPFASGRTGNKRSIVIVSFVRGEDKWKILQHTKKLKGTPGISIDQDFPEKTRAIRSKLLKLRNLIKRSGGGSDRIRLVSDVLEWRGFAFGWDAVGGLACNGTSGRAVLCDVTQMSLDQINDVLREVSDAERCGEGAG